MPLPICVSICATIGLPPVAISSRLAAVWPERDAAVDIPVADRIAQCRLAGVVGDRECAGGVLLDHFGDCWPLAAIGPGRADRDVVRLGAGRRQRERDREDREHDGEHDDDPGGADRRGRFMDG